MLTLRAFFPLLCKSVPEEGKGSRLNKAPEEMPSSGGVTSAGINASELKRPPSAGIMSYDPASALLPSE
jgi:hypothetical protein